MKAALVLCCLALVVAIHAAYACNSDTNNMPDCTNATNLNVKIRNFFDPTRYWLCNSTATATPQAVLCERQLDNGTLWTGGFLESAGDCVSWSEWKWVQPCQ